MGLKEKYALWCRKATVDADLIKELKDMEDDKERIEDAFYRNLEFGTGGLRGIIGAGTNRMNVYTVAKASQGVADYVKKNFAEHRRRVAVSYDSRIKSDVFSRTAAGVFAANGIKVDIFPELMPTPCLSYAVRKLGCAAGVMVTASHNPADYNGYKVYGEDGCQITTNAAEEIQKEIDKLDVFSDVKRMEFSDAVASGVIQHIDEPLPSSFVEEVKKQSVLFGDGADKNISIVYTPLNGTGLKPVLRTLDESGYTNITVVKEQEKPDGNFPTCPYPNPEIKEAMSLGMKYADEAGAEILLATDPDCDRVGIAARNTEGKMQLLTGNEVGVLLLDYICVQRTKHGNMPDNPIFVKTIVTTDMAERIAKKYGVQVINVLTGFKYIGEQIGLLERDRREEDFIFGFEESCGYLSGGYVRDKDAVGAVFLICEMAAYYKTKGLLLTDRLLELYEEYGFYRNYLHSYKFDGFSGTATMEGIMEKMRSSLTKIGMMPVKNKVDYSEGMDGMPKSDVIKVMFSSHESLVVRPSGTEPKIKIYIAVNEANEKDAEQKESEIRVEWEKWVGIN